MMTTDRLIYRHRLWVRVTHWVNVVCMTVLLVSGLQIFNAHPALYWGEVSNFGHPLIAISGFPDWATLPGSQWLAMGRRWHFFFAWLFVANGLIYALLTMLGGHLRRDLLPSRQDLRQVGLSIRRHLRLRFPKGAEAKHYNVLQKLTYLVVMCLLCPLIVLAGFAMSPQLDAGYPWLLSLFDGRQSARTIHFLCAFSLFVFAVVHLLMVLVSGVWNNIRSMITGWYDIGEERG
ncbi:MAG: cytochrome b/b6 domain-containing protein [Stellaceae bacterium]